MAKLTVNNTWVIVGPPMSYSNSDKPSLVDDELYESEEEAKFALEAQTRIEELVEKSAPWRQAKTGLRVCLLSDFLSELRN